MKLEGKKLSKWLFEIIAAVVILTTVCIVGSYLFFGSYPMMFVISSLICITSILAGALGAMFYVLLRRDRVS